jgi:hypothetical protein
MASPTSLGHGARGAAVALTCVVLGMPTGTLAQRPGDDKGATGGIYTCTDERGRKLTSDRPIPECNAKEQKLLNRDGSLRQIVPPTLTAEERAEREAAQLAQAQERAAMVDAVRRDRNLKARFPNEAAHRRSREAALEGVRVAMKASERRLDELAKERKPLLEEAEFYIGRNMPFKLKQAIEANNAAVEAQRNAIATQEAEMVRINRLHDVELDRLRKLWAGAAPGSLGPVPSVPVVLAPAAASAPGAAHSTAPHTAPRTAPNPAPNPAPKAR